MLPKSKELAMRRVRGVGIYLCALLTDSSFLVPLPSFHAAAPLIHLVLLLACPSHVPSEGSSQSEQGDVITRLSKVDLDVKWSKIHQLKEQLSLEEATSLVLSFSAANRGNHR